jgi:hypothetical protein
MFTGVEDQTVSLETASTLTSNFRRNHSNERKGGYFSRKALTDLLDQNNCVGVRIYYGNNSNDAMEMVMVGVKNDESDLIDTDNLIMDKCIPCPDRCGESNVLNSTT